MNTYEKSLFKDTFLSGGLTLAAVAWLVFGGLQTSAQSTSVPSAAVVAATHAPTHAG